MIVYDTREGSGTTKHFAKRVAKLLGVRAVNVRDVEGILQEDYILCTYTAGRGEVPITTQKFLQVNSEGLQGVVANGSSNFKQFGLFCVAGDRIADTYNVEQIKKIDMGGTYEDVVYVAQRSKRILGLSVEIDGGLLKPKSTFINGQFNLQSII